MRVSFTPSEELRVSERYSSTFKWLDGRMKACDWSIKDGMVLYNFPFWLLKKVYSKIDEISYKGRRTRGRMVYFYIPEEYTIDKIPIIVKVDYSLGTLIIPTGTKLMSYSELKKVFKNNKFEE